MSSTSTIYLLLSMNILHYRLTIIEDMFVESIMLIQNSQIKRYASCWEQTLEEGHSKLHQCESINIRTYLVILIITSNIMQPTLLQTLMFSIRGYLSYQLLISLQLSSFHMPGCLNVRIKLMVTYTLMCSVRVLITVRSKLTILKKLQ